MHSISLPKDVKANQIIAQLILSALFMLWASAPDSKNLMKIKADEFYHDVPYDQGLSTQIFKNFYSSRAGLITKRATFDLPKPPSQ